MEALAWHPHHQQQVAAWQHQPPAVMYAEHMEQGQTATPATPGPTSTLAVSGSTLPRSVGPSSFQPMTPSPHHQQPPLASHGRTGRLAMLANGMAAAEPHAPLDAEEEKESSSSVSPSSAGRSSMRARLGSDLFQFSSKHPSQATPRVPAGFTPQTIEESIEIKSRYRAVKPDPHAGRRRMKEAAHHPFGTPLQRERERLKRALDRFHTAQEQEDAKHQSRPQTAANDSVIGPVRRVLVDAFRDTPISTPGSSRPTSSHHRAAPPGVRMMTPPMPSRPHTSHGTQVRPTPRSRVGRVEDNFATRPATAIAAAPQLLSPRVARGAASYAPQHFAAHLSQFAPPVPFWLPLTKREGSSLMDELLDAGPETLHAGGSIQPQHTSDVSILIHRRVEKDMRTVVIPEGEMIARAEFAREQKEQWKRQQEERERYEAQQRAWYGPPPAAAAGGDPSLPLSPSSTLVLPPGGPNLLSWVLSLHPERAAMQEATLARERRRRHTKPAGGAKSQPTTQPPSEDSHLSSPEPDSSRLSSPSTGRSLPPSPGPTSRPLSSSSPARSSASRASHESAASQIPTIGSVMNGALHSHPHPPPSHRKGANSAPPPNSNSTSIAAHGPEKIYPPGSQAEFFASPSISRSREYAAPASLRSSISLTSSASHQLALDSDGAPTPQWKLEVKQSEARLRDQLMKQSAWAKRQQEEEDAEHAKLEAQQAAALKLSRRAAPSSLQTNAATTAAELWSLAYPEDRARSLPTPPTRRAEDPDSLLSLLPPVSHIVDKLSFPSAYKVSRWDPTDLVRTVRPNWKELGGTAEEARLERLAKESGGGGGADGGVSHDRSNSVTSLDDGLLMDDGALQALLAELDQAGDLTHRAHATGAPSLISSPRKARAPAKKSATPRGRSQSPDTLGVSPSHRPRSASSRAESPNRMGHDVAGGGSSNVSPRPRTARSPSSRARPSLLVASDGGDPSPVHGSIDAPGVPSSAGLLSPTRAPLLIISPGSDRPKLSSAVAQDRKTHDAVYSFLTSPGCTFLSKALRATLSRSTPWPYALIAECRASRTPPAHPLSDDAILRLMASLGEYAGVYEEGEEVLAALMAKMGVESRGNTPVPAIKSIAGEATPTAAAAAAAGEGEGDTPLPTPTKEDLPASQPTADQSLPATPEKESPLAAPLVQGSASLSAPPAADRSAGELVTPPSKAALLLHTHQRTRTPLTNIQLPDLTDAEAQFFRDSPQVETLPFATNPTAALDHSRSNHNSPAPSTSPSAATSRRPSAATLVAHQPTIAVAQPAATVPEPMTDMAEPIAAMVESVAAVAEPIAPVPEPLAAVVEPIGAAGEPTAAVPAAAPGSDPHPTVARSNSVSAFTASQVPLPESPVSAGDPPPRVAITPPPRLDFASVARPLPTASVVAVELLHPIPRSRASMSGLLGVSPSSSPLSHPLIPRSRGSMSGLLVPSPSSSPSLTKRSLPPRAVPPKTPSHDAAKFKLALKSPLLVSIPTEPPSLPRLNSASSGARFDSRPHSPSAAPLTAEEAAAEATQNTKLFVTLTDAFFDAAVPTGLVVDPSQGVIGGSARIVPQTDAQFEQLQAERKKQERRRAKKASITAPSSVLSSPFTTPLGSPFIHPADPAESAAASIFLATSDPSLVLESTFVPL